VLKYLLIVNIVNYLGAVQMDSNIVGSIILTVCAIIATYPAIGFLLQYAADAQNSGALYVGGGFAVLAVVLWGSALWGWLKVYKTRKL
jgi:hypothetical protein